MKIETFDKIVITNFYSIYHTYSVCGSGNTRKNRSSWAIVFKYDGETQYSYKKNAIVADRNNLAILPKGTTYKWKCLKSGHFMIIEFDCNLENTNFFLCKINNHNVVLDIFKEILYEKTANKAFSNLKIYQSIYKLLFTLFSQNLDESEYKAKNKIIRPALAYINENFSHKIDNDELALICNVSTSYFRRLFKESFQISPMQYIIDLRIKHAKELLQSDYTSVYDVARQVGYDDVYHFSKLFKQKTGTSPLNYLKNKNNKAH